MNHHQKEGGESLSKVPDLIGNISMFKPEFQSDTGYHDFFRSTSDKGYKSDSSQFRSKSQATNQTTTSPLSSLSDTPEEIENIRPEDGRRKRNRKERESRLSRISNSEPPLYKVKTRIGEHNFESINTIK